jgi:hypothetical protein
MDTIGHEFTHVILAMLMKNFVRPTLILGLSVSLALFSTAMAHSIQPATLPDLSGASLFQITPTPQTIDRSEIGSTDEIIIMGGVIVLIIIAPIFISRKAWR